MSEKAEIHKPFINVYETERQSSVFHDRYEPPFMRWVEEQGLPKDADDDLVMQAMTSYLESRDRSSISQ